MTKPIAQVLFPRPFAAPYDYLTNGLDLAAGQLVTAPLGKSDAMGVVTALLDAPENPDATLKPIGGIVDTPPLPANTLKFINWVAWYNQHPVGSVLKMALRGAEPAKRPKKTPIPTPDPDAPGHTLTTSQTTAAKTLMDGVDEHTFAPMVLEGVTGSGKTETYFTAVAHALRTDPTAQILILTPEIALAQDVAQRFADRFNATPPVWHADIADGQRKHIWKHVADGDCRVVIGARSALFLPFNTLRLIVVDEEHDGSYKQEEGLTYHARDMAVTRAHIEKCACVLASATPSLETHWNVTSGKYKHAHLAERATGATLPTLDIINMRDTPPEGGDFISPPLRQAIRDTLEKSEQSLLFLNRRGYAPLTLCRNCGHRLTAPDGDNYLVEHKYTGRLHCHLTGFSMPKPKACPECNEPTLVSIGPGVERVAQEAKDTFPDAKVVIMSSDITESAKATAEVIAQMEAGEIDILVATQMAAKGHNFPNLTLVGVVDADLGLRGADLRAAERTYQIIHQVAGRAGRAAKAGRALIQTYDPEHTTMTAIAQQDRSAFLADQLNDREALGLPPFGRLVAIVVSGRELKQVESHAMAMVQHAPQADGFDIYGPAEPAHSRIRGQWRRRILLRADAGLNIQAYVAQWRKTVPTPRQLKASFDIDPQSFV